MFGYRTKFSDSDGLTNIIGGSVWFHSDHLLSQDKSKNRTKIHTYGKGTKYLSFLESLLFITSTRLKIFLHFNLDFSAVLLIPSLAWIYVPFPCNLIGQYGYGLYLHITLPVWPHKQNYIINNYNNLVLNFFTHG